MRNILSFLFGPHNFSFINRVNPVSVCYINCRSSTSDATKDFKMKYLNVAEKNDAAKTIAGHLSRGTSTRREGLSTYNKIYEFNATVLGQQTTMVMTSVSGHLLGYEFVGSYKSWQSCNPLSLFEAPVVKSCAQDYQNIKKTLEREIRSCQGLIIWTDCDREGENIGFEIIQVCSDVKPNLKIYRAKFSEITATSVNRALQTLGTANQNVSNAVDVRQELDLRIGAAFTRFQTLRLQKVFPDKLSQSLVSYGSCQFPTLGFVVERYRAVENFIPEKFWKLKVSHTLNSLSVDFAWKRVRLFDEQACMALHDVCQEEPTATVTDVKSKSKSKWRPLPLDTIELEKLGSRKLKINAKEVMKIAEKLYTQGIISYPRTETNIYPKELNLAGLVEKQTQDGEWGRFAQKVLDAGPTPRQGNKSDQAHPPIHPTKHVTNLSGNEKKVYELIVRSFLACCSSDAQGHETVVEIDIADEKFSASGLVIIARNYLEVYPYDKWTAKEIHLYEVGQTFQPSVLELIDGQTSPPNLLTEADLISLMEKHGIGTDATHADHIETIKNRSYVALADSIHFVPGLLGMGLVEGYDSMGLAHSFSKPHLRAGLEADLKEICEGRKRPQDVLTQQIANYREAYVRVSEEASKIDEALSQRFNQTPLPLQNQEENNTTPHPTQQRTVLKCPKCKADMMLRSKKDGQGLFISCMGYPQCKNALWLPSIVDKVKVLDEHCETCGRGYNKIEIMWKGRSLEHMYPSPHKCCIAGCDTNLLQVLNINISSVQTTQQSVQTTQQSVQSLPNGGMGGRTTTRILSRNTTTNTTTTQRINNTTDTRDRNNSNYSTSASNPSSVGWFSGTNDSGYTTQNHFDGRGRGGSSSTNNQSGHDDNQVVCNCSQPAILLTVKKASPNFGRQFYKCAKPKESGGCDFFLWASSSEESTTSGGGGGGGGGGDSGGPPAWGACNRSNGGDSTWGATPAWGDTANDTPTCNCNLPSKKLTVQKEGPNKGRIFYSCPKPPATRCTFFSWLDAPSTSDTAWSAPSTSYDSVGRGRGRGRGGRGGGGNTGGGSRKRCGVCREEGHTRNKCPKLQ